MWRAFFYALLVSILGSVLWLWAGASAPLFTAGTNGILIAFGRLAGLLTELTILLQLILLARVPILERAFGFDRMNRLHRIVGHSIAGIFIFHPTLLTIGYAREHNYGLIQQFLDFWWNWEDVAKAIIGAIIFAAVIFITIFFRKRLQYETWHGIHLFAYVGIAFAFGHQINFADVSYGWAMYRWLALNFTVFGIVLFYRVIRPLILYERHHFYVREVRQETQDIWSVIIGGRNMEKFKFEPGQFAQWFFLDRDFIWPHPFTLSAAPNGETVRVTPKAVGDFTRRIKDLRPGSRVVIDGPLGRFTITAAHRSKFLLIAGGVGITPIRALAEGLAREKRDTVVLYAARSAADFALAEEIPPEIPLYKFVSDASSVIPGHDPGSRLLDSRLFTLNEVEGRGNDTEHRNDGNLITGIIDINSIHRLVPDFAEREIYICGPKPMMDALEAALCAAGVDKKYIHTERFAF